MHPTKCGGAALGLVASYVGIYFYLRVIQYLFTSPDEQPAGRSHSRGVALGASPICLVPVVLLAVLSGWVIARL